MSIDSIIIEFVHSLCEKFGFVLTPILRLVSILGEKCWFPLLFALFMFLRKRTRWIGATAILAVFIGFLLADLAIKPFFMRVRPYLTSNELQNYWLLAGAYQETGYSMPSGHTVGITAFFTALLITSPKSYRKIVKNVGVVSIVLMILSRCYFMHHYFSDCVVGILVGIVSAYISKLIIKGIHYICKTNEDLTLFKFILNFDIMNRF